MHFVSEIGYHGCPSVESVRKFIDEDYLWTIENNEQWILHSSAKKGNPARDNLMINQIKQLFAYAPKTLEEFAFAVMCGEFSWSKIPVIASNDTLCEILGSFKVTNLEDDAEILNGEFTVGANSNSVIGQVPLYSSDKGMLLIEWFVEGKRYINHYLYGMPAFNIEDYKRWVCKKLNKTRKSTGAAKVL